jgi:hypothetical protein
MGKVKQLQMDIQCIMNVLSRNGEQKAIQAFENVRNAMVQIPTCEPDINDKQRLVDMVIEELEDDIDNGDCTVLNELLMKLPWEILKDSLPEDKWKLVDKLHLTNQSIWSEIRNDFEDEGIVNIDAWLTDDDMEGGTVITKVNVQTKEVEYLDDRAKTDVYAQEMIQEILDDRNPSY